MIALSIGDPTVFGNLKPAEEVMEAVVESVRSMRFNGYAPSTGYEESRSAVATYVSIPGATVEAKVSRSNYCKTFQCHLTYLILLIYGN